VRLIQQVAHTTSRDFLAVSTGALEVLLKYLGRIRIVRVYFFNFFLKKAAFLLEF